MSREVLISFVIPSLNEEKYLGRTLQSIHAYCKEVASYEILVCDHGSTDATPGIARQHGATLLQPEAATIAGLRNAGAAQARGEILVFLDSDVSLTPEWGQHARGKMNQMLDDPMQISGSRAILASDGNWLQRIWFQEVDLKGANHIGTPHMIMPRKLFERIDGFDDSLVTGEDYDIYQRALAAGARNTLAPEMVAVHHRIPSSLGEMVRRERWHGVGDTVSLAHILDSKVALMTLLFIGIHALLLVALFLGPVWVMASLLLLALHLLVSAHVKFGHASLRHRVMAAVVFYFYYLGRGLSFLPGSERRWKPSP